MSICLVIIDVQNGFLSEETKFLPNKIRALLEKIDKFFRLQSMMG